MDAVETLLKEKALPTALWCASDYMAIGAMNALKFHGLSVPGDVSVVGCDNIQFSAYMQPELATIRVPKAEMGRLAADMLCDIINGIPCEDAILTAKFQPGGTIGGILKG